MRDEREEMGTGVTNLVGDAKESIEKLINIRGEERIDPVYKAKFDKIKMVSISEHGDNYRVEMRGTCEVFVKVMNPKSFTEFLIVLRFLCLHVVELKSTLPVELLIELFILMNGERHSLRRIIELRAVNEQYQRVIDEMVFQKVISARVETHESLAAVIMKTDRQVYWDYLPPTLFGQLLNIMTHPCASIHMRTPNGMQLANYLAQIAQFVQVPQPMGHPNPEMHPIDMRLHHVFFQYPVIRRLLLYMDTVADLLLLRRFHRLYQRPVDIMVFSRIIGVIITDRLSKADIDRLSMAGPSQPSKGGTERLLRTNCNVRIITDTRYYGGALTPEEFKHFLQVIRYSGRKLRDFHSVMPIYKLFDGCI